MTLRGGPIGQGTGPIKGIMLDEEKAHGLEEELAGGDCVNFEAFSMPR
jgi:hypothetical protein